MGFSCSRRYAIVSQINNVVFIPWLLSGTGQELQVLEWLSAMNTESAIDWDEIFEYLPGTIVELKDKPGVLHRIDCYEAMMVPPIWLANDPRPRYPHELRIVSRREVQVCQLECQPVLV